MNDQNTQLFNHENDLKGEKFSRTQQAMGAQRQQKLAQNSEYLKMQSRTPHGVSGEEGHQKKSHIPSQHPGGIHPIVNDFLINGGVPTPPPHVSQSQMSKNQK